MNVGKHGYSKTGRLRIGADPASQILGNPKVSRLWASTLAADPQLLSDKVLQILGVEFECGDVYTHDVMAIKRKSRFRNPLQAQSPSGIPWQKG